MSISVKIALGRPETFIFWDIHPLIGSNFKVAQLKVVSVETRGYFIFGIFCPLVSDHVLDFDFISDKFLRDSSKARHLSIPE